MSLAFDVSEIHSLHPLYQQHVSPLIPELMDAMDGKRDALITEMMDVPDFDPLRCSIILIHELMDYLTELRCSRESQVMDFLQLIHALPVPEHSPQYDILVEQLAEEYDDLAEATERFGKMQLLYLFSSLEDLYNCRKLADMLEHTLRPGEIRLNIIYSLAYTTILQKDGREKELITLWLSLILHCFYHDGPECATYILIRWIISIRWQNLLPHKKYILQKAIDMQQCHKGQNTAMALYELFEMAEKLVTPQEKFGYFKRLTKLPPNLLTVSQLQYLYFFAGNYTGAVDSRFKDSILFYQYSNYFLYKCWDHMRAVNEYLRMHMTPDQYYHIVPTLEKRVLSLGNQISLQNNAYVETLQTNYATFEQLYKQVEELSLTDTLTGLRNRRYLQNNIFHMIHLATRHRVPICFAMIDIDHFKVVNDTYGHAAGDFVLKELAMIITRDFRKSDLIIRYGGEEFLMLLFDTNGENGRAVMESVREAIEKHRFDYRGTIIPITVSIGVSVNDVFNNSDPDINKKIAEADKAMYEAKNSGRNRVCTFEDPIIPA